MIIDDQTTFSWAQAVTASAASTNYVDTGIARNLGVGQEQLYLVIACVTSMTDGASDSTVIATVQTDTTSAFGAPVTLATDTTFAALSAAGTSHIIPLSPGWAYKRFLRIYYTVANGNLTTGNFSAFIVSDVDLQAFYGIGYTVS
jgi:hypothetical protein